jgi:Bacterial Ig domain
MPERTRFATLLAFVLIGIGALRVYAVVDATPLLGYANQFDMRRISACVGLWPDLPPAARLQAHPEAPIRRYVRGERRPDECYWSSELLFVAPVAAILADGETVDLRVIGAIKAVTLIVIAFALGAMLRRRPALALVHGVVFALVLCDPIVTLWLNTLYTEFTAVLFAYASVVLLVAIGMRATGSDSPSSMQVAALALSLIGLGLSRQQHLWLPALLIFPLVISLWTRARRSALLLIAVVGAIAFAQAELIGRHPTIAQANNADVVLGAILPASNDEALTAKRLGLPERCLRSVGATWYQPMGEALEATCPEALAMHRRNLAALVATEPATLLRAVLRPLPQLQDWRLGYLGSVEGLQYAGSDSVRSVAGALASGIGPALAKLPLFAFLQMLAASAAIFLVSALVCVAGAVSRRCSPLALTLYALTCIAWYAIMTSIFGDGYVEVARHAQLASVALYATVVVLAAALFAPLLAGFGVATGRAIGAAAAFAVLAIGAAVVSQAPLRDAMIVTPMTFGVVDRPLRNKVPDGDVELSGWAIDPQGVARVEFLVDGGATFPARYGLPYLGARNEPLALYFPAYPNTTNAGFTGELPAQTLAGGAANVRTVVINSVGTRTEIDRRQLVTEAR